MQTSSPTAISSPARPIGVIIPTYNRWERLFQCLQHLEAQTWKNFEVFVVDDGSTDGTRTRIENYQRSAPFPMSYLHQANSGPARARNFAIANLNAPICLMIGDDIFPTPDFVRLHLEFHQTHPALEAVAVGLTRWSERHQLVTPHMRWLDRDGVQFSYGDLLRGVAPSWKHFYTSNLSVKTAYLRDHPFHEGFRKAGMEDIELGYRLAVDHGLAMFFLPDAIAEHVHPTTFTQSCRRAVDAGAAEYLFAELWPEHRAIRPTGLKRVLRSFATEQRLILPILARFTSLLSKVWCPNPLSLRVIRSFGAVGYGREAARRAGPSSAGSFSSDSRYADVCAPAPDERPGREGSSIE